MAAMRLTAWEEERLLIFTAAELARRHRDAGLRLNHPEAVAIACDAMLEMARAGGSYGEVEAAGRSSVTIEQLMPGVAGLIDEVRLEVLLGDGPRLVVLVQPFGAGGDEAPGAVRSYAAMTPDPTEGRERRRLTVHNRSRRIVRVSSHYPFERVNQRLAFDRAAAAGFRLDLPAGATERWAPGESKEVELVRLGGDRIP
jgi:urease subunit gamma/beta